MLRLISSKNNSMTKKLRHRRQNLDFRSSRDWLGLRSLSAVKRNNKESAKSIKDVSRRSAKKKKNFKPEKESMTRK